MTRHQQAIRHAIWRGFAVALAVFTLLCFFILPGMGGAITG